MRSKVILITIAVLIVLSTGLSFMARYVDTAFDPDQKYNHLLTKEEWVQKELSQKYFLVLGYKDWYVKVPLFLLYLYAISLVFALNPLKGLRGKGSVWRIVKFIVAVLVAKGFVYLHFVLLPDWITTRGPGKTDLFAALPVIMYVMLFCVIWLLSSPEARDGFTRRQSIARVSALGAAAAASAILVTKLCSDVFESFDGTNFDFFGIFYLELMLLFVFSAIAFVYVVCLSLVLLALSPQYIVVRSRVKLAALPVALCAALVIVGVSMHKSNMRIINKFGRPLSELAGLEVGSPEVWGLLTLAPSHTSPPGPSDPRPVREWIYSKWPLEIEYLGSGDEKYPASQENQMKIEKLRASFTSERIRQYSLRWTIWHGYLARWELSEATSKEIEFSFEDNFSRFGVFRRARHLPPTPDNVELVRNYVYDERWHYGPRGVGMLAYFLRCMGLDNEADEFVTRTGGEVQYVVEKSELECARPIGGAIRGRIEIEGKAPKGSMIALYESRLPKRGFSSEPLYAVALDEVAADGGFRFTHLREQGYYLVLVDNAGYLGEATYFEIENNPWVITINSTTPDIDLGTIEIRIKE